MSYQPPYTITPRILQQVADIVELLTRWGLAGGKAMSPQLRRNHRIRTIQASLAIENNSLSVEQVTAVLAGKRVLGLPHEIQEVRNAFAAYEQLPHWQAHSKVDLLAAHGLLMAGLVDDAGSFRAGGVGIYKQQHVVHMAPPASRVDALMADLLAWLASAAVHPLIASCVFDYECEFIHPFTDGNGRLGRLWQTSGSLCWRIYPLNRSLGRDKRPITKPWQMPRRLSNLCCKLCIMP
ncbi:MAG: Fic family protein [Methylococcales bacterium]|nr:Fic family protein [Methylococcales bacterium]